jgi:uncharacterized protein (DUF1697 family)
MPGFVALLRGVNVGGKVAKMETVRASFEALGFQKVRTYVQSGNVLFAAKSGTEAALGKKIAGRLPEDVGFPIAVQVFSAGDLARIADQNPLLKEKGVDPKKLHVTFLDGPATAAGVDKMQRLASATERVVARGKVVYLYCPDGYGRSKLNNNAFERALKVGATTRNWNTVTTLVRLLATAD